MAVVNVAGWPERLRAAGLRVTQPRTAVLSVLEREPHLAADQVVDRVRTRLGTVSVQAIYDTLNTLASAQLLRRFEPAGSSMRFEIHADDNHHHLVCRNCRRVVDVPCAAGQMPCAVPANSVGFEIDEAEITYWGHCADCRATPNQLLSPAIPSPSEEVRT